MATTASFLDIMVRLRGNVDGSYTSMQNDLGRLLGFTSHAQALQSARNMRMIGRELMFSMTLPIIMLGRSIIRTGTAYDTHMNAIRGASQATADEMEKMNGAMMNMSRAYRMGPVEVAAGMERLAHSYGESFSSVAEMTMFLPHAIELSIASQQSMEVSTRSLLNVMNQYHVRVQDVGIVNDILTNAFINTTAELPDLMMGLRQTGAVAFQLGLSLNDTVTAIALLRQSGMSASQTGTNLRNMLFRLVAPAGQARETLRRVGATLQTNADGTTNLVGTIARLRDLYARGALSRADILQIGGQRGGASALLTFLQMSSEHFEEFSRNTQLAGTTSRYVQQQLAGLPGAMMRLSSSWERLKLSFTRGELGKILGDILGKFATLVEYFESLSPATKKFLMYFVLACAIMPILIYYTGVLRTVFLALPTAIRAVGRAMTLLAAHPIIAILMVIAMLVIYLRNKWLDFIAAAESTPNITEELGGMIVFFTDLFGFILDVVQAFWWVVDAVDGVISSLGEMKKYFQAIGELAVAIQTGDLTAIRAAGTRVMSAWNTAQTAIGSHQEGSRLLTTGQLYQWGRGGLAGQNPSNPWFIASQQEGNNPPLLGMMQMLDDIRSNTRQQRGRGSGLDFSRSPFLAPIVYTGSSPWHYGMSPAIPR
jgi:TP901 family phage tail tape measure protein